MKKVEDIDTDDFNSTPEDHPPQESSWIISGIHPKLEGYKFDRAQDCYEFMLRNQVPKETTVISPSLSKSTLETLKCVGILVSWSKRKEHKDVDDDVLLSPVFVKLLIRLFNGIRGKTLEHQAERVLHSILEQLDLKSLLKLMKNLEELDKNMVCLSMIYNWMQSGGGGRHQKQDFSNSLKAIPELYVKEFLMTKIPKQQWIQEKVSTYLLPLLDEATGDVIISNISKALLRSPETAIGTVGYALAGLKPHLSEQISKDLARKIGPFLGSDNEKLRQEAYFTSQALLNTPCSSPLVILTEYFELVSPTAKGTKSALTSGGKINVLKLIRSLVDGDDDDGNNGHLQCADMVIEKCLKVLETDVHEGTLLECLEVIGSWSKGLDPDPDCPASTSLLKYIKNGLTTLKSTLRLALCRMLVQLFAKTHTGEKRWPIIQRFLPEIRDLIFNSIDKALAQPSTVHNLTELVSLCVVLVTSSSNIYPIPESILSQIAKVLGDRLDENFLGSWPPWIHSQIALLLDFFITNEFGVGEASPKNNYYRALALCLCCPDRKTRQQVKDVVSGLLLNKSSLTTARRILNGIHSVLKKPDVAQPLKQEMLIHFSECVNQNTKKGIGMIKKEEVKAIALDLLVPCHENEFEEKKDLWQFCLKKKMGISPKELIEDSETRELLLKSFVEEFDLTSSTKRGILRTLFKEFGARLMGDVVKLAVKILEQPEFLSVSRDDYFIFRSPEGQLYNTEAGGGGGGGAGDSKSNMKRESKAYSYQEQLEEIQLRKELEEKRKAEGKSVKYTAKQMEAMKIQLAKESAIRAQVKELDSKINNAIGILRTGMETDLEDFEYYVKNFVEELISMMKSAVGAPPAVDLFIQMGKTLFLSSSSSSSWFGEAVAQSCLRLINPLCDLEKNWQELELKAGIEKVLERMKKIELSNAALSFCHPFFTLTLQRFPKDENILTSILQIISTFSSNLGNEADTIPRAKISNLLYQIILGQGTVAMHHHQQLAASTLVSFCKTCQIKNGSEIVFLEPAELKAHLDALKSHVTLARETSLSCLHFLCESDVDWMKSLEMDQDKNLLQLLGGSVYRSQFDPFERVADIGRKVWEILVDSSYSQDFDELSVILKEDILHPIEAVRVSASKAIGFLLTSHKNELDKFFKHLKTKFDEYEELLPLVMDDFGRVLKKEADRWEARAGIGLTVTEIAPLLSSKSPQAEEVMRWIGTKGFGDRSGEVHGIMLEAALEMVKVHGLPCVNPFIKIVDEVLEKAEKTQKFDKIRVAAVVLMGSLAKYLNPLSDKRVNGIFDTLLETLSTPSEKVQEAVANCLPELVQSDAIMKEKGDEVIRKLIKKMMSAEDFGVRRGSAFGLAGVIKGLGILSLKKYDLLTILAEGLQDKKDFKRREGSLMGLELLCSFLGRLFEPYVVQLLPLLLQCLGDANVYVREATENTAKMVMSHLSGHGVKLVLPTLTAALSEEESWRTKVGSVELLGRMAYCAPRQLSGCLPMIVPKLIEVLLGDSHVKVQEAAAKALELIGSVIQNPEVKNLVPVLLEALQDVKKAGSCLQSLLRTHFVHVLDPASLALIMPVVERAFNDRSTENRKLAAQIIGNMFTLTDHGDLAPYLESVMPGIKGSLLDSLPEVRAVAAKALRAMAKGMGEERCYQELLPWLMSTLISENVNGVDRSGAAQGLAEVVGGALGPEEMDKFMNEIIRKANAGDSFEDDEQLTLAPHVRDGYMMMFIYMPGVLEPTVFREYIGRIIPPILKALADDTEFVRETALLAAQRIVSGFSESAITLLLPELEKGVFDPNWRIRHASVQLLGDLLFKISGVSGKMSTESANEDDNFGTEQSGKLITAALGLKRRNRVLSALYMGRSDVALLVRVAALHVWKVVVANTPKTLREILPTLFSLVLACLSTGESRDKRMVAERSLKDLVRKLGEKILGEVIPLLEKGLGASRPPAEREGVCRGLCEIMGTCSRDTIIGVLDSLVPPLKLGLCDTQPKVRKAAAQAFAMLHSAVGPKAVEEIVPFLMTKVEESKGKEGDLALDALGQMLIVKERAVMPHLIPQLTTKPVNTRALAFLAEVAGNAVSNYLGKILPFLLEALEDDDDDQSGVVLGNCGRIILTVSDEDTVGLLIEELLGNRKRAAVQLLSLFCRHSKADLGVYFGLLLRGLIDLMTEKDEIILGLVAQAVEAVVKRMEEEKINYVEDIRRAMNNFSSNSIDYLLPGLCLSTKGINPLLPIYREAVLKGGTELKVQATLGIGELISLSSGEALKPSMIQVTGPLIRILGDRYGAALKCAVLDTLTLLLKKVGVGLKPFVPQLQTTFLKSSSQGEERNVRVKAAHALGQLVKIHSKPDTIFLEVLKNLKNENDDGEDTLLYTLRCCVETGGARIGEGTRRSVLAATYPHLSSPTQSNSRVAGGTIGALIGHLADPDFLAAMNLILTDEKDISQRIARTSAMVVGLKLSPARLFAEGESSESNYKERILETVLSILGSDNAALVSNGVRACAHIFTFCVKNEVAPPSNLIQPFAKAINNSSNEAKVVFGQACEVLARNIMPANVPAEAARYLIPALVNGSKDKDVGVRASCESALIWLLCLKEGDNDQVDLKYFDSGARDTVNEVMNRVLPKKLKEPNIDDTILC